MDSLQIIIICCNEERRRFQQKQMEDLELPYAFFNAYTPRTMGNYIQWKHKTYPESDTTVCCMRSHIEALKMFVEKFPNKEYVVISEDDALLIKNFKEEIQKTIRLFKKHKEIEYVRLGCGVGEKEKPTSAFQDDTLFWGPAVLWSAILQLIPMEIAKDMVQTLDKPNTTELFLSITKRKHAMPNGVGYQDKIIRIQSDCVFNVLWYQASVWPPMAIENENFNSCISPDVKNTRWQYLFDLNIMKKEDFYSPISSYPIGLSQPYVINLKHRKDRWEEVQNEFMKIDVIPNRIDAVLNKEKGYMGCLASHIVALKEGQRTNMPVWICEDDIHFLQPKNKLFQLIEEFLKSDGDILCLSYNSGDKREYNHLFARTLETQTTGSYIIKPAFLPILLQLWEEVYECYYKNKKHLTEHLFLKTDGFGKTAYYCADICWKILQPYYIFLIPKEKYAIQRESYSDIEHKIVKYL